MPLLVSRLVMPHHVPSYRIHSNSRGLRRPSVVIFHTNGIIVRGRASFLLAGAFDVFGWPDAQVIDRTRRDFAG